MSFNKNALVKKYIINNQKLYENVELYIADKLSNVLLDFTQKKLVFYLPGYIKFLALGISFVLSD